MREFFDVLSKSVGSVASTWCYPWGVGVSMSGDAAVRGRNDRQAASSVSARARDYLRKVALADCGCAAFGAFAAIQPPPGDHAMALHVRADPLFAPADHPEEDRGAGEGSGAYLRRPERIRTNYILCHITSLI